MKKDGIKKHAKHHYKNHRDNDKKKIMNEQEFMTDRRDRGLEFEEVFRIGGGRVQDAGAKTSGECKRFFGPRHLFLPRDPHSAGAIAKWPLSCGAL